MAIIVWGLTIAITNNLSNPAVFVLLTILITLFVISIIGLRFWGNKDLSEERLLFGNLITITTLLFASLLFVIGLNDSSLCSNPSVCQNSTLVSSVLVGAYLIIILMFLTFSLFFRLYGKFNAKIISYTILVFAMVLEVLIIVQVTIIPLLK